jgi:hypothetical protein
LLDLPLSLLALPISLPVLPISLPVLPISLPVLPISLPVELPFFGEISFLLGPVGGLALLVSPLNASVSEPSREA